MEPVATLLMSNKRNKGITNASVPDVTNKIVDEKRVER